MIPEEIFNEVMTDDVLRQYRDERTDLIGVNIVIRPADDDPSSIFSDSDYYFRNRYTVRTGVAK